MLISFDSPTPRPSIDSVWFTQPAARAETVQVSAVSPVDQAAVNDINGNTVVALSANKVLFAALEFHAKPLPIRLPINGTPTRLVYSTMHKRYFVASKVTYTHDGDRYVPSQIFALPKHLLPYQSPRALLTCPPGQTIRWLTELVLERDDKKYSFLVVATADAPSVADAAETGSIRIFKVIIDKDHEAILQEQKTSMEDAAVNAMCQFDDALIYCTGTRIKKRRFLANGDSKIELLDHPDAGPVQYIVAHPPFVSISFAKGSARVYRVS